MGACSIGDFVSLMRYLLLWGTMPRQLFFRHAKSSVVGILFQSILFLF